MKIIEFKEEKQFIDKVKKINENTNPTYYIMTMGCLLNENDSEKLSGMIEEMGYTKCEEAKQADLIVFNTCCIRENAEEKLFGKLGELKNYKADTGAIIAIGGCMMQEEHITEKLKNSYPFYDIIFGTHTINKFPEDLYNTLSKKQKIKDILDIEGDIYEGLPIKRTEKSKALVTIMYGCNNFCTYCIVPYVRGRERSRKPEDILKEIKDLAKDGCKELTLLGQNVNSYNGGEGYTFAKLLQEVEKIEGIERIRFISPHPKDFTDDVIETIANSKKICKILHLPLQSGSTNILKRMNRKHTKESFLELVEKIQTKITDVVLSTDIIVGFPRRNRKRF